MLVQIYHAVVAKGEDESERESARERGHRTCKCCAVCDQGSLYVCVPTNGWDIGL
jgi:hypothetical protein